MQETLDVLSDDEALADLRQSREDFAAGDTFDAAQVRAELEPRRAAEHHDPGGLGATGDPNPPGS
jgi:antitoxin YefM